MIPIRDDTPCQRTPVVNYTLMVLCAVLFLLQIWTGRGNAHIVERLGMVPARMTSPADQVVMVPDLAQVRTPLGIQVVQVSRPVEPAIVPEWFTLITCIFLHGGWLHFIGNMWFLYIFGDNVEDRVGHATYAILYIGTGVVAGLCHLVVNSESAAPTIGASGAIAGVMGAYLWMFPRAQVLTVVPLLFLFPVVILPAPVFLTIWFVMQFWSGAFAVSAEQVAGVAWWAHIGGFLAGLACGAALGSEPEDGPAEGDDGHSGQNWYAGRNGF